DGRAHQGCVESASPNAAGERRGRSAAPAAAGEFAGPESSLAALDKGRADAPTGRGERLRVCRDQRSRGPGGAPRLGRRDDAGRAGAMALGGGPGRGAGRGGGGRAGEGPDGSASGGGGSRSEGPGV